MGDLIGANSSQESNLMLQLAYCRALELAQFRGGFLARTAHELRSPLNKVISLQQMILEGLCDDIEEEREFVAEAQAASLKLLEYLDFVIRISKIESNRIIPKMQRVSLAETFEHVKEMTHLQAADRNLRLIVESPDQDVYVLSDPTWLRNALAMLIDIAVDSSDRGTIRLTLATDSPQDAWHVWIEDDRPAEHWREFTSLPTVQDFDLKNNLSSSLRMSMVESMLQAMSGSLTLLSTPSASKKSVTRLQCGFPKFGNPAQVEPR